MQSSSDSGSPSRERRGRGCLQPHDDVLFAAADVDVLNEVLNIIPELKICALAVKERKKRKVAFPITDHESVFNLFDGEELTIANHRINRALIDRYIHPGLFPIQDDQSLMRVIYLALTACNQDLSWALNAPPHAEALLRELKNDLKEMN